MAMMMFRLSPLRAEEAQLRKWTRGHRLVVPALLPWILHCMTTTITQRRVQHPVRREN
jgi:hypothetical protein